VVSFLESGLAMGIRARLKATCATKEAQANELAELRTLADRLCALKRIDDTERNIIRDTIARILNGLA
jgi:hypothetical protein